MFFADLAEFARGRLFSRMMIAVLKARDSGMPDASLWEAFFDANASLEPVGCEFLFKPQSAARKTRGNVAAI